MTDNSLTVHVYCTLTVQIHSTKSAFETVTSICSCSAFVYNANKSSLFLYYPFLYIYSIYSYCAWQYSSLQVLYV